MTFGPEEITARIAEFAATTDASDWPDAVRREALRSFFNIVGCTIGGARHGMVDIADTTLGAFAGPRPGDIVRPRPQSRRAARVADQRTGVEHIQF